MLRCLDSSLDRQDCEDLTQQVFLEVWRNPGRFRGDSGVLHFLVRIAANLLRSHRRGAARRTRREADAARAGQDDCQAGLRHVETAETVRSALASLPVDQRQAVDLVYLHGCTISEASAIIGCSPAAMKKRLYRGKRRLVKQLGQTL
jgi:RNA polymerase sigma-70 factor (ECF subfamily)